MRFLFFFWDRKSKEIHRRIKLSIWAYAYEFESVSLVPDSKFDSECKRVDLSIKTGNEKLDQWWVANFDPSTGQWIQSHPELSRIKEIYNAYYVKKRR